MQDILGISLKKLRKIRSRRMRMLAIVLVLSLIVSLDVFWALRQPGLTLAGDADCKIVEHTHDEACQNEQTACELLEHVHSISCYSDVSADVETQLDWQNLFADYPYTGNLQEDLVGIARTQVGYQESTLNFEVGDDGIRRGYTRYGAWYGTPYTDWSAIFVSFCLHYAGADPSETPGNSGAASMAEIWKTRARFAYPGEHDPAAGDLIFFSYNTVGIVTAVQNATCYVIHGDIDNAVCTNAIALSDPSIVGWGLTGSFTQEDAEAADEASQAEQVPSTPEISNEDLPDSFEAGTGEDLPDFSEENTDDDLPDFSEEGTDDDLPDFSEEGTDDDLPDFSEEGTDDDLPDFSEENTDDDLPDFSEENTDDDLPDSSETETGEDLLDISNGPVLLIIEGGNSPQQAQTYSLRNSRAIVDLLPYLEAHGGNYFFTLSDFNNAELPKDENGNYLVEANEGYKLTITFNSPEGFAPGTYQYQVPNGLMVDGGEGVFVLKDGTNVGSWVVTDTGLITLVFNENMNSRTDITISAALGIHFPEQEEPIDFDGLITVTVKPPVQQQYPTVLSKWGSPNEEAGKINWTVRIDGYADSQIPGNILTDQVMLSDWSRPHSYTASDIAGGLSFGASDPSGGWHAWHVSADNPHLIWDESGWSYKIPKTVTCDHCGELELGNEGWVYYINYTSTPTQLNTPGTFDYENKVTVDGATASGWSNFNHGQITAEIIKDGSFVADATGGAFLWEFQATIPGRVEGQRAEYAWFISDEMRLLDESGTIVGRLQNDAHLSTVTAIYNGELIRIPRIQDATENDMFAWDNAWTATENGISYTRNINLLCRCQCTPDTCHWTNCGDYWFQNDDGTWATKGFCQCWTETQNMTFTFVYKTTDLSEIEGYGALDYQINNHAQLFYMPDADSSVRVSYDDATVPIPNLFEKLLTHDFDGYTANYKITVNEAKLVLTDGTPLYIRDAMSDTLAFISGSLVISAEDANGNITTLQQGTDYTVVYDGTGSQRDEAGNKVHVLDIVILHPQPVMYILDYDATLIIPEQVTGAIKYSNSAEITLWGESIKDNAVEKVYADINIAAKSYKVEMFKTCAKTGKPLGDATFGLYNAQGGLITAGVTDTNGKLLFQTNIVEGIILREHILYYMQELRAPPGYRLDTTKYWFCFCDRTTDTCEVCAEIIAELNATRIPFEQIGKVHATNEVMKYLLPDTGGPGIYPFISVCVIFIITPLVYNFILRRKRERRGVG